MLLTGSETLSVIVSVCRRAGLSLPYRGHPMSCWTCQAAYSSLLDLLRTGPLRGKVRPVALTAHDKGKAPQSLPMLRIFRLLGATENRKENELQQVLRDQQAPQFPPAMSCGSRRSGTPAPTSPQLAAMMISLSAHGSACRNGQRDIFGMLISIATRSATPTGTANFIVDGAAPRTQLALAGTNPATYSVRFELRRDERKPS